MAVHALYLHSLGVDVVGHVAFGLMIEGTFPMASATGNAKLVQVAVHIVTDRAGDTIINLVDAKVALVS